MISHVKLLRGLWQPALHSYQLKNSESMQGLWKRVILLILASGLIFGISAYFGIGSEYLSRKMTDLSTEEFEMQKALFMIGQVIWGVVYAALILFIPAVFFWTLTDLEIYKLITIQFMVLAILLIEKIVMIPLAVGAGLSKISSPFSLGVIGQYLTGNEVLIYFFAAITFFKLWTIFIQYKYLRVLSEKSKKVILAAVIGMNIGFWFLSALLSYIELEKLI